MRAEFFTVLFVLYPLGKQQWKGKIFLLVVLFGQPKVKSCLAWLGFFVHALYFALITILLTTEKNCPLGLESTAETKGTEQQGNDDIRKTCNV